MTIEIKTLERAIQDFDSGKESDFLQLAEQERKEFLNQFPIDGWPAMTLERYTIGHKDFKDSFCYWMEWRTQHLGSIKGGSARKLLIYGTAGPNKAWRFDETRYSTVEDAWEAVRTGFMQAIEFARNGEWNRIDEIDAIQTGPALRTKTLHIYFPEEILPVYAAEHLRHFLRCLKRPEAEGSYDSVALNMALLSALRSIKGLEGFNTVAMMRFLYSWERPGQGPRIVKIAPGEAGKFWDECFRERHIRVGWGQVGDLQQYSSEEEYKAAFTEKCGPLYDNNPAMLAKKAKEVWTLRELQPGDLVFANKGTSRILAVGEVTPPGYVWREDLGVFGHTLSVKWDTSYAKDIEPRKDWAFVTVKDVPASLAREVLAREGPGPPIKVDPVLLVLADSLERKGQVILYGPPGTGKTYTARRFAVWWLLRQIGQGDPERVLGDPSRLASEEKGLETGKDGIIKSLTRITFHPSYSYEDFIEGFRPVQSAEDRLVLRLEDGLFKRVCSKAASDSGTPYVVLIDEINRANVPKVFGEILTLLERDKRDWQVILPQSKEIFRVPPNVFIIGTMNTADRSIRLLDAALRRRFAFEELMPDYEILRGGEVQGLRLDEFLSELNRRIAAKEGREKQVGHSYLLDKDGPVSIPDEFARRFRQEILPLLQEYCYDDYGVLADYIGEALVDRKRHMLKADALGSTDLLIEELRKELCPSPSIK